MSNRQARLSHARVAVLSGNDCLLSNPFVIVPVTRFPLKSVPISLKWSRLQGRSGD